MKSSLIIIFVLLSGSLYSQSNYYLGYEEGYRNGCSCNAYPPNSNHVYKNGSYDQGFLDGKLEGRLRKLEGTSQPQQRPALTYPNNSYRSTQADLLYQSLAYKQQLYDKRVVKLQELVDDFWYVYALKTKKYGNNVPKELSDYANEVIDVLAKQTNVDLSNESIWSGIYNYYLKHRNNVAAWQ